MNDHADFDDFPGLDAIADHAAAAQRNAVSMIPQPDLKRPWRWTPMMIGAFGLAAAVALVAVLVAHRPAPTSIGSSRAAARYVATFVPDNLALYSATNGSAPGPVIDQRIWLFGDPNDPLGPRTFGVLVSPTTPEAFDQELSARIGTRVSVNGNVGYVVRPDAGLMPGIYGQVSSVTWRVAGQRFSLLAPNAGDAKLEQLAASIDTTTDVPLTATGDVSPLGEGSPGTAIPFLVSNPNSSAVIYAANGPGPNALIGEQAQVLTAEGRSSSLAVLTIYGGQKTVFRGAPAVVTHWEVPLDSSPQPMTIDMLSWADSAGSLVSVLMTGGDAGKVRQIAEGLKTVDEATWQEMVAKSQVDHPDLSCNGMVVSSDSATAQIVTRVGPAQIATAPEPVLPSGNPTSSTTSTVFTALPPVPPDPVVSGGTSDGGVLAGRKVVVGAGTVIDGVPDSVVGSTRCGAGPDIPGPGMQGASTPDELSFGGTVTVDNLPAAKVRWGQASDAEVLSVEFGNASSMSTGPAGPVRTAAMDGALYGVAEVGLDVQLMPLSLSDAEASAYTEGIPVTKSTDPAQGGYFAFGVAAPAAAPAALHLVARDSTGKVVWSGPLGDPGAIPTSGG
jgi:hypothetical protein